MADHVKPRGNADTADNYLTAAGEGLSHETIRYASADNPARRLAALQGIGWALLAAVDQLADLTDAATANSDQLADIGTFVDVLAANSDQLAEIATSVDSLADIRPGPARGALTGIFARLARNRNGSRWPTGGAALTAPQTVIARQALADAAAWRAWRAEGPQCTDCAALDPGKCAEHAGDEDLANAYAALRARLPGGDGS